MPTDTATKPNAQQISIANATASIAISTASLKVVGNYGMAYTCMDAPLMRSEKSDLLRQLNDKARKHNLPLFESLPKWVRTSLPRHLWAATKSGNRIEDVSDLLFDSTPEQWVAILSEDGDTVSLKSTHKGIELDCAADPANAVFTINATEFDVTRTYTKTVVLHVDEWGEAGKDGKKAAKKWSGAVPVVTAGGKSFTLVVKARRVNAEKVVFRSTLSATPPSPDTAVSNTGAPQVGDKK